jgi:hypothetical protein
MEISSALAGEIRTRDWLAWRQVAKGFRYTWYSEILPDITVQLNSLPPSSAPTPAIRLPTTGPY